MDDLGKLKVPFVDIPPSSIEERREILRSMSKMLIEHEEEFYEALYGDLHKPHQESLTSEILPVKLEIAKFIHNLESWLGEKSVSKTLLSLFDTTSVQLQPLGKVLVIGAWNYPLFLALTPTIGALAAGNAVVLKPSEMAPQTEALLAKLLPKYVDESVLQVFTGGAKETMKLLDENRFDHVIYTGGSNVARSILAQLAKNLTPVTLELGGKCPVYVDLGADLVVASKRIIWGKGLNAGQTCVAPDYIICHSAVLNDFVYRCIETAKLFYSEDMANSSNFSRIINPKHTSRLQALIKDTKGKIVYGGKSSSNDKFIEFTIVTNVQEDDVLMQDEIFGPILPILKVDSYEDAIKFINKRSKPLTIYVFTSDKKEMKVWKDRTTSGSLVFNDCVMQMAGNQLPFGGVGESGVGRYFGYTSLTTFSNSRSLMDKSMMEKANNLFRYPPYTANSAKWTRWIYSRMENPVPHLKWILLGLFITFCSCLFAKWLN